MPIEISQDMKDRIRIIIAESDEPIKASQIAKMVVLPQGIVNSFLYSNLDIFQRDDSYRWSLADSALNAEAGSEDADETQFIEKNPEGSIPDMAKVFGRYLELSVDKMNVFNYALYHNGKMPVHGIKIKNNIGLEIDIRLKITSDNGFIKPYEEVLNDFPSGKAITIPDPEIEIDGQILSELTEAVYTNVTVELVWNSTTQDKITQKMMILAYDQWLGIPYSEYLPALIMPNHPVVSSLLHDASVILKKWGKETSLEDYQAGNPNRVRELAAAAYEAIRLHGITYVTSPASFADAGQRIRTPEVIMEQRLGTCMDMTLLYAACLEAMGLHTILYLIEGHIFAGVWLVKKSFDEITITNCEQLKMRMTQGSEEIALVECTSMCSGKEIPYELAEYKPTDPHLQSEVFCTAIDVEMARNANIRPVPSRVKVGAQYELDTTVVEAKKLFSAPDYKQIEIRETYNDIFTPHKITNKRELWESRLLDLSTRNVLLSLPNRTSFAPIMSVSVDTLEDAISDGYEFKLNAAPNWITGLVGEYEENGVKKQFRWIDQVVAAHGVYEVTDWQCGQIDFAEKLRNEYKAHRMYTFYGEKEVDRRLTAIYRAANQSQQETGVSSLYLAIGLLKWYETPTSKKANYAPIILLPIEIVRKSANQGYALHMRDEDPRINTTLLEMLWQMYHIDISDLDPLPADEHGIDIKAVFKRIRSILFTVKNWDVIETCVIGNFSFAQFAMWNDMHSLGDVMCGSKIVNALTKGYMEESLALPEDIDDDTVFQVMALDDTQLRAVKMAAHNASFVLHGPPGTGKSQTITCMIANLLAHGKRVLFVAEKMAALTVVQRRLEAIGLGDFCLELHSDKANKKNVLSQFEKALTNTDRKKQSLYSNVLDRYVEAAGDIEAYTRNLHRKHTCGYSLFELINLYEENGSHEIYIPFSRSQAESITFEQIQGHIPCIRNYIAAQKAVSTYSNEILSAIGRTEYTFDVREKATEASRAYISAVHEVRTAAHALAAVFGIDVEDTVAGIEMLQRYARIYEDEKDTRALAVDVLVDAYRDEALRYLSARDELSRKHDELLIKWKPDFEQIDVAQTREAYVAAKKKLFGRSSAINAVAEGVNAHRSKALRPEEIPEALNEIESFQTQVNTVSNMYDSLSERAGNIVCVFDSIDKVNKAREIAKDHRDVATSFPGGIEAIWQLHNDATDELNHQFIDKYTDYTVARDAFDVIIDRQNQLNASLDNETQFAELIYRDRVILKAAAQYNAARIGCLNGGLSPVMVAINIGMPQENVIVAYKNGLYYELINSILSHDDVLSTFIGSTFEETLYQFKQLDSAILSDARAEIYNRVAGQLPTIWSGFQSSGQLNILRKAIGSKGCGISIRTLFEKINYILPNICPCMLMSPNSVAQYLEAENNLFDVVIFDEASQLPTCKAVSALARAKNAIIVGDPKQMPPTTFFASAVPETEDIAIDDLDSILDDALALGIPSLYLQWHYRSTHESLIAFSNRHFYKDNMYTFPSVDDRETRVYSVHIAGVYQKSVNLKEAEEIVAEIIRRYHDPVLREQSIGVVTFNVKQQDAILDILTKQFKEDPELDAWANNGADPLFVKNLENVQGDERDAILFSTVYGPNEKGTISMNFGPINKQGGEKRLNVAFSRARISMTIFTSMYSSDIRVTPASSEGVRAMQGFLKFAESRLLEKAPGEESTSTKGMVSEIVKALTEQGYTCDVNVGHSKFRMDLAVVDPYDPDRYILGIKLDSNAEISAHDGEVGQKQVLKNLGWTVHHVWTVDYWDNKELEIAKITSRIDDLKPEAKEHYKAKLAEQERRRAEEEQHRAELEKLHRELEKQAQEVSSDEDDEEQVNITKNAPKEAQQAPKTEKPMVKTPEVVELPEMQSDNPDNSQNVYQPAADNVDRDSSTPVSMKYVFADYKEAVLPLTETAVSELDTEVYHSIIREKAKILVETEAPIDRFTFLHRLSASFGYPKSEVVMGIIDKETKKLNFRTTGHGDGSFIWNNDQIPAEYNLVRSAGPRSIMNYAGQEIRNAICYTLQEDGPMTNEQLIKSTSVTMGYKRLGKNIVDAITEMLTECVSKGIIVLKNNGTYELK